MYKWIIKYQFVENIERVKYWQQRTSDWNTQYCNKLTILKTKKNYISHINKFTYLASGLYRIESPIAVRTAGSPQDVEWYHKGNPSRSLRTSLTSIA